MPRDVDARLRRLRERRRGLDRVQNLNETAAAEIVRKSLQDEAWQTRSNRPNTKYALGAMQEVGADYTRISIETAQRVGSQLYDGLTTAGISSETRLQGSVPLNVHIRGVSDVDLLVLDTSFLTYRPNGWRSQRGYYTPAPGKSSIGVIYKLRSESEGILERRFYAADVDKSGAKAIKISGGSLPRSVDVVPSHWHDNESYQVSGNEHDRSVTILNKDTFETIENLPFLHIKRVTEVDVLVGGNLKKAIRLCKNVKNDSVAEGRKIPLSSFDIASLLYHADRNALLAGSVNELAVLAETQRFLDVLYHNKELAQSYRTPDNTRRVLDNEEKYEAVKTLSFEMDDLAKEVLKEQSAGMINFDNLSLYDVRNRLSSVYRIN